MTFQYLVYLITMTTILYVTSACDSLHSITVKENIPYPSHSLLDVYKLLHGDMPSQQNDKDSMYLTDSTGSRPFTLSNGKLFVSGPLDREHICSPKRTQSRCCGILCCMYIGITTSHGKSDTYIKVTIEDENDNEPTFLQPNHKVQINENLELGYAIVIPKAIDRDSITFGIDRYDIIQDKNCVECFQVKLEAQDGSPTIILKTRIDRETHSLFNLQILAIDKGQPAKTGTLSVTIEVIDSNDNTPKFEQTSLEISVEENGLSGREIRSIKVTDNDFGDNGRISYEIEDYTATAQKHFRLFPDRHGVNLCLQSTLDFESFTELSFKIIARDHGSPSLSSTISVKILVLNVNDEPPEIMFYKRGLPLLHDNLVLNLPENTPKQQSIILLHVTDKDSMLTDLHCDVQHPKDVFILHENPRTNVFEKKKIFDLQNSVIFDRETTSMYRISILCFDSSINIKLTHSVQFQLRITDENDNLPIFSSSFYFGKITETNYLDKFVDIKDGIRVTDADVDSNSRIKYSLSDTGNSTDSQTFSVTTGSPRIRNIAPIDYEEKKRYVFLIVAQDCGTPSQSATATVTINVIDANDNKPEISQKFYSFSVLEEEPIGTDIGQITASDADSETGNKDFVYEIISHDRSPEGNRPNKLFSIENNTGKLKTRMKLDHEKDQNVNFLVRVKNTNNNVMSHDRSDLNGDSTSVNVIIIDINDNPPKLVLKEHQNPISGSAMEPQKPLVITIKNDAQMTPHLCVSFPYTFSDADDGINSEVRVTLKDNPHFLLDLGHNLICQKNDNLSPGSYSVYVIGEDRNGLNGSRQTEHLITVLVQSNLANVSKIPQRSPRQDPDEKSSDYKAIIVFIVLIGAIVLFCVLLVVVVIKTKLCIPRNLSPQSRNREKIIDKQNNTGTNKNYNIIGPGANCENKRLYGDYRGSVLNNQGLISSDYAKNLFYPGIGTPTMNYYPNSTTARNADIINNQRGFDQGPTSDLRYEQLHREVGQDLSENSPKWDQSKEHRYNYLLAPIDSNSLQSNCSKGSPPKQDIVAVGSAFQKSIHDVYLQTSFV